MSIAAQDPVLAWRRITNYTLSLKPQIQLLLQSLKTFLAQQGGNPDLEVVPFDNLSSTEVVIANAACKLYALVLNKVTATATFTKATDSATTSSDASSEIRVWSTIAGNQHALIYPSGQPFANGITMQGNTTAGGGTGSGADGCEGFAIIGNP